MDSDRPVRAIVVVALAAFAAIIVFASTPWQAHGGSSGLSVPGTDPASLDPVDPHNADGGQGDRADLGSAGLPDPDDYLDASGRFDVEAAAARAAHLDAGGLHEGLRAALARAREQAAAAGVEVPVASGYRSAMEQARLLEAELAQRGAWEEATRWVFPPDRSMHVRGLAVDVDSGPGADWLLAHGARFGLCQTLDWEWWHFEWRERWERAESCPPPARTPAEFTGP